MSRKTVWINGLFYLYILLPIVIFMIGWLKWFIGMPAALVILYSAFRAVKEDKKVELPEINKKTVLKLAAVFALILIWVYMSGIGGFVFQNRDHYCRNEIFNILVENKWPVVINGRGLIYYIGYWLPSAVIGKTLGLDAGYVFQFIWAVLGIGIVYVLMSEHFGRFSVLHMLGFIFFSGLDMLGCWLTQKSMYEMSPFMHLEWWSDYFQFSSNTTQLFWVFNQAIYAWVLLLMLMRQKDNRHMALILGCGLLECTIPFVGLIPFAVYKIVKNWTSPKDIFTFENVLGGGCAGILTFLYVIGNVSAGNIAAGEGSVANADAAVSTIINFRYVWIYILFLFVEAGIYAAAMVRYQYKNILLWIALIWLAVCPWIRVGGGADFCMRASIPALFTIMIMFFDTWNECYNKKHRISCIIFTVIFVLGCMTPVGEFSRTVIGTCNHYAAGNASFRTAVTQESIMEGVNFSGDADSSLFFKYLAKKTK